MVNGKIRQQGQLYKVLTEDAIVVIVLLCLLLGTMTIMLNRLLGMVTFARGVSPMRGVTAVFRARGRGAGIPVRYDITFVKDGNGEVRQKPQASRRDAREGEHSFHETRHNDGLTHSCEVSEGPLYFKYNT